MASHACDYVTAPPGTLPHPMDYAASPLPRKWILSVQDTQLSKQLQHGPPLGRRPWAGEHEGQA